MLEEAGVRPFLSLPAHERQRDQGMFEANLVYNSRQDPVSKKKDKKQFLFKTTPSLCKLLEGTFHFLMKPLATASF